MGYTERNVEDIKNELSDLSREIVRTVEVRNDKKETEIFLIEPSLPNDFKPFIQRIVMVIDEMEATSVVYNHKNNSLLFWFDY